MTTTEEVPSTVNRRISHIRKILELSQAKFSKVLSLSSGYLAGIEVEKRKVNDRVIKLICGSFKVSEKWLREGEGEIFTNDPAAEFTKLTSLYKELHPKYQSYILKQVDLLLDIQGDESGLKPILRRNHGDRND